MRRINVLAVGLLGVLLIGTGLIWYLLPYQLSELTDKEIVVIDTLFEKTKPQCIGRYVIDVPESFDNQLKDSIYIDDFKIESKFIYPPAFKQRIELREKELREAINLPGNEMKNAPYLKEVILLPDGKGVIFDRNKPAADDAYRVLEAHVYVNNIAFIITTGILDLSADKYAKEKKSYMDVSGYSEFETNTKQAKLTAMRSLISRISGRLDHEIPSEKGACIPNGFILDDGKKHQQQVTMLYENADLFLSFESDNRYLGSSDTLLNREKEINEVIHDQGYRTIKKGNLSPNEIPSQEWLVTKVQEVYFEADNRRIPNQPYYDFHFFANEATATDIIPKLDIGMHNQDKFTSYSDAQMVEIWDRIIGSLRYKPNAF